MTKYQEGLWGRVTGLVGIGAVLADRWFAQNETAFYLGAFFIVAGLFVIPLHKDAD